MTCKDCIHYELCLPNSEAYGFKMKPCGKFKPKSRYIELPCAVGDTVYWWNKGGNLTEAEVTRNCITAKIEVGFEYDISYDEIGKTVFLTREEAEKALERSSNEKV